MRKDGAVELEPAPVLDGIALWLLRLGADRTGRLTCNLVWDVAVRAAVLCDLRANGRLVETADQVEIDDASSGVPHEDLAVRQLLDATGLTEERWMQIGGLRSADVAAALVGAGEWTARRAPLTPGGRTYRAGRLQHADIHDWLITVYAGLRPPPSYAVAALAVLAHALKIIPSVRDADPISPVDCGPLEHLLFATVGEIEARDTASRSNPGF
jgi:hypothetical protein